MIIPFYSLLRKLEYILAILQLYMKSEHSCMAHKCSWTSGTAHTNTIKCFSLLLNISLAFKKISYFYCLHVPTPSATYLRLTPCKSTANIVTPNSYTNKCNYTTYVTDYSTSSISWRVVQFSEKVNNTRTIKQNIYLLHTFFLTYFGHLQKTLP
jgi:hypothetical protein